jgi:SSS family solute:Na+ symporter
VFAGLLAGVMCAALLILGKKDPIGGVNAGFVALCLNFAVSVVVSLLVPASRLRSVHLQVDRPL